MPLLKFKKQTTISRMEVDLQLSAELSSLLQFTVYVILLSDTW